MTKSRAHIAVLVGAVSALAATAFIFLVSPAVNPLAVTDCRPDSAYPSIQTCVPLHNGWSLLQRFAMAVGFFIVPLLLGAWFGGRYARGHEKFRPAVAMALLASVAHVAVAASLEAAFLQPWDSVPYNRYALDAIFGTAWSLLFVLICLVGVSVSSLLSRRLWNSFKPLGFRHSRKPL